MSLFVPVLKQQQSEQLYEMTVSPTAYKRTKLKDYLNETNNDRGHAHLEKLIQKKSNALLKFILSKPKIKREKLIEKSQLAKLRIISNNFERKEKQSGEIKEKISKLLDVYKLTVDKIVGVNSQFNILKKQRTNNLTNCQNIDKFNNNKYNSQFFENTFQQKNENEKKTDSFNSLFLNALSGIKNPNLLTKNSDLLSPQKKSKFSNNFGNDKTQISIIKSNKLGNKIWYLDGSNGRKLAIKYGLVKKSMKKREQDPILINSIVCIEKNKKP